MERLGGLTLWERLTLGMRTAAGPLRPRYLVLLTVVCASLAVEASISMYTPGGDSLADGAARLLIWAVSLSAAVAGRWPSIGVLVFIGSALGLIAVQPASSTGNVLLAPAMVVTAVALLCASPRRSLMLLALLIGWVVAVDFGPLEIDNAYAWFLPAFGFGALLGLTAGRFRVALHSTQARNRTLERQQEEIRAQERRSLARDLHDVVAHQLTAITLVAGSRSRVEDPALLKQGLEEIRGLSREALMELRTLLDVLREDDDGGEDRPKRQRVLATAQLEQGTSLLRDRLERFGFTVVGETSLSHLVNPRASIIECALRVAQESTTNVIKYARPASEVSFDLFATPSMLTLEVVSPLKRKTARRRDRDRAMSSGRGIIGMRERVDLLGGTAEIGPQGDVWQVRITLPLDEEATTPRPVEAAPAGPVAPAASRPDEGPEPDESPEPAANPKTASEPESTACPADLSDADVSDADVSGQDRTGDQRREAQSTRPST